MAGARDRLAAFGDHRPSPPMPCRPAEARIDSTLAIVEKI